MKIKINSKKTSACNLNFGAWKKTIFKFQKASSKKAFPCAFRFDACNSKFEIWDLKFDACILLLVICCLLLPQKSNAQELNDSLPKISLKEAVQLSKENFYLLKNERLEIAQQEALKIAAWDLGETEVFTGGEELGGTNPGIYTTIGINQKGIDVFGIAPKSKFHKEKILLAEKRYELTSLELAKNVKSVWAKTYLAKKKYALFVTLDSIYTEFEKAVSLKFEVEAISRLEMLNAKNKVNQIWLQKKQAHSDYLIALKELNLWLGAEIDYTVADELDTALLIAERNILSQNFEEHPSMQILQQQIAISEAKLEVAQAAFLPEFSLQYGLQKINGNAGFYNYEIGISIPLLSGSAYGNAKAEKIQRQITEKKVEFNQKQLRTGFQKAVQRYQKWKTSWEYYKNEALSLVKEQRKSSLFAYKNGAIGYVAFIQNLNSAIDMENEALEVLENYLNAVFELQFYLK